MRRATYLISLVVAAAMLTLGLVVSSADPPPVELGAKAQTQLYVRTLPPGAKIVVDGNPYGISPRLLVIPSGVVKMTIEVELEGHAKQARVVEIRGGRITRVEFEMDVVRKDVERADAVPAVQPRLRHFVRLVVGQDTMTFEGRKTSWEELPKLLEKVPNRQHMVLEIARPSDEVTIARRNQDVARAGQLARKFEFEYLSEIGVHPLGSKGTRPSDAARKSQQLPSVPALTEAEAAAANATRAASRLDLRIAATREGDGAVDKAEIDRCVADLEANGPEAGLTRGDPFAWFPIQFEAHPPLITAGHQGHTFVLLANTPEHTMLSRGARPWGVTEVTVYRQREGCPAIGVEMDDAGGRQFGKLTETHIGRPLAILVDDHVLCAPVVRSKISRRVEITGSFDVQEAGRLAVALMAGMGWAEDAARALQPADPGGKATAEPEKFPVRPVETPVEKTLSRKTSLEFAEVPLAEVIRQLDKKFADVSVLLDRKALDEAGVDTDAPITVSLTDVSLRAALNEMLWDLHLTWTIRHGVLLITTREESGVMLAVKIYDVADLGSRSDAPSDTNAASFGGTTFDYDSLIDTITRCIGPNTWDDIGGPGQIVPDEVDGREALVILQTQQIHDQIVSLLADLRRAVAARESGESPSDKTFSPVESLDKLLGTPISLDLVDAPLTALVEHLQKQLPGVNVVIDRRGLADQAIKPDWPISLKVADLPARSALTWGLTPTELYGPTHTLDWILRDEVVVVTTPEEAANRQMVKVYDVAALKSPGDSLEEAIYRTIDPISWDEVGGPGSGVVLTVAGGPTLVVRQTRRNHERVAELLGNLRRIRQSAAGGGVPECIVPGLFGPQTPAIKTIRKALAKKVSAKFQQTPLTAVLEALGKQTGINIALNRAALADVGLGDDAPITTSGEEQTLQRLLRLTLGELDLTSVIRDGVLLVTTVEEAGSAASMSVGVYPIGDLVVRRDRTGRSIYAGDVLARIITGSIVPASWTKAGGPGSFAVLQLDGVRPAMEEALVILQTAGVHEETAQLLAALRKIARQTAGGQVPDTVLLDREAASENKLVRETLARKVDVEFDNKPLEDVIESLKETYQIEMQIDSQALHHVNVPLDVPVTFRVSGVPLRSALALMLEQLDLTYICVHTHLLLVTTPQEASIYLPMGLYPVGDLVADRGYLGLMETITTTIQPSTWLGFGGPGAILAASFDPLEVLVVSQTAEVHREIAELLHELRGGRRPRPVKPGLRVRPDVDGYLQSPSLTEEFMRLVEEAHLQVLSGRKFSFTVNAPARVAARSLKQYGTHLFRVMPQEEERLQQGKILAASGAVAGTISRLEKAKVELPWLSQYLIEQFRAGKLSGLRLEVAARILNADDVKLMRAKPAKAEPAKQQAVSQVIPRSAEVAVQADRGAPAIAKDVAVGGSKTVRLPDLDARDQPVLLDLPSGGMFTIPSRRDTAQDLAAILALGGGHLAFEEHPDGPALICIRGARAMVWKGHRLVPLGSELKYSQDEDIKILDAAVYKLTDVPRRFMIATDHKTHKTYFDVTVLELNKGHQPDAGNILLKYGRFFHRPDMPESRCKTPEQFITALKEIDDWYEFADETADPFAETPVADQAIPALLELLGSDDAEVRYRTLCTFGKMGATRHLRITDEQRAQRAAKIVPSVTALLRDEHDNVRWHAAFALLQFGPDARTAVAALDKALGTEKEPSVQKIIKESLDQIEPGETDPPVDDLKNDGKLRAPFTAAFFPWAGLGGQ